MTTQSELQQQIRGFSSPSFALSSPELPAVPAQFPHSLASLCLSRYNVTFSRVPPLRECAAMSKG